MVRLLLLRAVPGARRKEGAVSARVRLALWLIVWAGVLFAISAIRFASLHADTMDLGYQAQMFWQISHGNWWAFASVFQTPALAGDGAVTMYPVAYGFRFLGGPYFLFALQAVGVAVAGWGIYRAAVSKGWSVRAATAAALVFSLLPGILGGSQFDYHPDFVALPFVVWAYVFYQADRRRAYYLCLVAAALSKNMALFGIAGWGVGLLLYRRRWLDGLVAFLGALALLGFELDGLFPRYFPGATGALNASLYGYLGHGLSGIALGVVTHLPTVLVHLAGEPGYALWLLAPLLALPLIGAEAVPAWLALALLNGLSQLPQQQTVASQYQVLLTAWLMLAFLEALSRWPRGRRRVLVVTGILAGVADLAIVALVVAPLLLVPVPPFGAATAALQTIPTRDVVFTQTHLGSVAYRHPVFGQDRRATPGGPLIDGLPTLWREAPQAPTALVLATPTTPYLGTVATRALQAGYRVTQHSRGIVVLTGTRHFRVPPMGLRENGWEPASGAWTLPAWTRATAVGHPVWPGGALAAPVGRAGWLVRPFFFYVPSGHWRVTLATTGPVSGGLRCQPWLHSQVPWILRGLKAGSALFGWRPLAPVTRSASDTTLSLALTPGRWYTCGVWSTGHRAWTVRTLTLRRAAG